MALSNIFGQNLQNSQKLQNIFKLNAENKGQAADKKPEHDVPENIFAAPPQQKPQQAEGPGEKAKEIISKVKKMDKLG
jgi:hypothetical protein